MRINFEDAGNDDVVEGQEAEVARDESDMVAEAGNLEAQAVAAEDAVGAAEDLEAIGDKAEASLEDGDGLSDDAVEMAAVAVENAMRRFGATSSDLGISFESSAGQSRRYRTNLVMESVASSVKKIWERLKSWFKSMWQSVKDFFVRFFSNHDKAMNNLKALREKVSTTKGKPETEKMSKKSIAATFNIKGKATVDGAVEILENHARLAKGTKELFSDIGKAIDYYDSLLKAVKPKNSSSPVMPSREFAETIVKDILKTCKEHLANKSIPVTMINDKTSKKGATGFKVFIGPLADGETPELTVKTSAKDVLTIKLERQKAKEVAQEIAVLKKDQCLNLLTAAIDTTKAVREYRTVEKEINAVLDNSLKLIDQAMRTVESILDLGDHATEMRGLLSEVRSFTSDAGIQAQRFSTLMPAWAVRACNQAGAWVQASLSEYKEKD